MARYKIYFRDERGVQDLELDDVQLEDGIYELWRGKEAIERRFNKQRAQKLFKRFDKWGFRTVPRPRWLVARRKHLERQRRVIPTVITEQWGQVLFERRPGFGQLAVGHPEKS